MIRREDPASGHDGRVSKRWRRGEDEDWRTGGPSPSPPQILRIWRGWSSLSGVELNTKSPYWLDGVYGREAMVPAGTIGCWRRKG